jgi:hypothetical protein
VRVGRRFNPQYKKREEKRRGKEEKREGRKGIPVHRMCDDQLNKNSWSCLALYITLNFTSFSLLCILWRHTLEIRRPSVLI